MSGYLFWNSGNLFNRGTYGYFWASTLYSYTPSRLLYFSSTNVNPKNVSNKPDGFPLRCVARFLCTIPSRALRSLPLSVMLSGRLLWFNGDPSNRGVYGFFWLSKSKTYIKSNNVYFTSNEMYGRGDFEKLYGFPLRCVARFLALFLPELSAAFLFRL